MDLRENLAAVKCAFYASELVLKFTPDEQKNEALFNLLREFFSFLNSGVKQKILDLALAKFKINILQTLGLDISNLSDSRFFSNSLGGFGNQQSADARQVHEPTVTLFTSLKDCRFDYLRNIEVGEDIHLLELQNLLSQFVEYQLERKVLSEGYLNHVA